LIAFKDLHKLTADDHRRRRRRASGAETAQGQPAS
jgi:hypothetical protein